MRWYSALLLLAACAYFGNTIWTFYELFFPASCVRNPASRVRCINPLSDDEYVVQLYTSTRKELRTASDGELMHELKIRMSDINVNAQLTITANLTVPRSVSRQNRSLYAYVFATPSKYVKGDSLTQYTTGDAVELTRLMLPRPEAFLLVGASGENETLVKENVSTSDQPCMHLRKELSVSIVADNYSFSDDSVPNDLLYPLRRNQLGEVYRRLIKFDTLAFRERDLRPVRNQSDWQVTVTFRLISIGRYRFSVHMEDSLRLFATLGFTEKDTDEVKGIFMDTNFALLMATFLISLVHLLFDALAFKNDIQFWRARRTLIGLSLSTVVWRCVSTVIIFFYLLNEGTSLLVTVPCGCSVLIELWKCSKATKLRVFWSQGRLRMQFGERDAAEKQTEEFDAQATRYLCYALVPLCLLGAVYSLLYLEFTGWYSFIITMLADGVYAFGFVFMCPQLFVNYKLKSVAHLPWRVFVYKAFNTFIDDCFAFIIQMPTAHRVACFRDDVVFVVYLFQRWIYPVDKLRVNEYGQSFEQEQQKHADELNNSPANAESKKQK